MLSVLLPIIKPELESQFLNIWTTWFVTESTVEDEKFPGKLKVKTPMKIIFHKKYNGSLNQNDYINYDKQIK